MESAVSSERSSLSRRGSDSWWACESAGFEKKGKGECLSRWLTECNRHEYSAIWIAANLHITLPTPESHPDFPLWKMGVQPEQLWDIFWPKGFL